MKKRRIESLRAEIDECRERLHEELSKENSFYSLKRVLQLSRELDHLIAKYIRLLQQTGGTKK